MRNGFNRRDRQLLRLQGYDYGRAGSYFITICVQNRECLLGRIENGEIHLSEAGQMVDAVWSELPVQYPGVQTLGHVVMPNHVHGAITLDTVGEGPRALPGSS